MVGLFRDENEARFLSLFLGFLNTPDTLGFAFGVTIVSYFDVANGSS